MPSSIGCGGLIARQCSLASLVEFAVRVQRQRMRRNHHAASQCR
jgi:hypothetical protein